MGKTDHKAHQTHAQQHHCGDLGQRSAYIGAPELDIQDRPGQRQLDDHIGQGDGEIPHPVEHPRPLQDGEQLVQQGDGGQIHPAEHDGVHQYARPPHGESAAASKGGIGVDHLAPRQGQHGDGLHIGEGEGQLDHNTQGKGHRQIQWSSRRLQPRTGQQQPAGAQHAPDAHGHKAKKADGFTAGLFHPDPSFSSDGPIIA